LESDSLRVDELLGDSNWRGRWESQRLPGSSFPRFLAEEFVARMVAIGYGSESKRTMEEVRSDRNLPLYHLVFFSRHRLGYKFWKEARKYHSDQSELEFVEG
jgi:hypothetical protein